MAYQQSTMSLALHELESISIPMIPVMTTPLSSCAGHGISKGQLCKMNLPKGQLPADLHLRFGGIQILTLTQVNLGTSGFQELGSLKQLQQLTLSDIDGHFAAIGLAVVQHFNMNISRAGKLKHAEADRTKVQLMAALPYSDKSIVPEYVFISQQWHVVNTIRQEAPQAAQLGTGPLHVAQMHMGMDGNPPSPC